MATTTFISMEEYLRTVARPDVEFIDGELKERAMVASEHGLISLCSVGGLANTKTTGK